MAALRALHVAQVALAVLAMACGGAPFDTAAAGDVDGVTLADGSADGSRQSGNVLLPLMRASSVDDDATAALAPDVVPVLQPFDAGRSAPDGPCMTMCLIAGTLSDFEPCLCQ